MKGTAVQLVGISSLLGGRKIRLPPSPTGEQRTIFAAGKDQAGPHVMARHVVADLLAEHPRLRDRVGLIVNASFSPADYLLWSLAADVQSACSLRNAVAFDVNQGCVAFLQGLNLAATAIESGQHEAAVVFASEWFERMLPFRRARAQHWSDGAAAVLLARAPATARRHGLARVLSRAFATDGAFVSLTRSANGNRRGVRWRQDHPLRYRYFATPAQWRRFLLARDAGYLPVLERAVKDAGVQLADVRLVVQNNVLPRLSDRMGLGARLSTSVDLGVPPEGHVGSTDIPRSLERLLGEGQLSPGDIVALLTGGIGWSWGCVLLEIQSRG